MRLLVLKREVVMEVAELAFFTVETAALAIVPNGGRGGGVREEHDTSSETLRDWKHTLMGFISNYNIWAFRQLHLDLSM